MCSKLCLYLLLKLNHAYNYEFLFLSRLKLSTQCKNIKKNHYKTKNESLKVKDDSCFQVYSFTYYIVLCTLKLNKLIKNLKLYANSKFLFLVFQDLIIYIKADDEHNNQNDFQKISHTWRNTLMENLPIIANFSSMVMRTPSTSYLASQNFTYKSYVLRRFKPLLPNEETFEDMFTTMTKENNCESNEPPVVMNDLVNNFIFKNSLR